MNIKKIQSEIKKIESSSFAKKSDKQLMSYEILSELHKNQYQGIQPLALVKYNDSENRKTKLNKAQVREIRRKYIPHVYGKKRLAIEYGVSVSVIYRIVKGLMWKTS
jgi:DNA invertase Pin-like site-specific DNA recombinase